MLRPLGLRRGLAVSARGETPRSPPPGSLAGEISQYLPGVEILRSPHWVAGWGDLAVSARGGDPPEPPLGCWLGRSRSICPGWRSSGAPIWLLAGEISQYLPGVKILRSPHWVAGWGDLAVSARGEDPPEPPIGLLAGGSRSICPGGEPWGPHLGAGWGDGGDLSP